MKNNRWEHAISETLGRLLTPRSLRDLTLGSERRRHHEVGGSIYRDVVAVPLSLVMDEAQILALTFARV
jgi:hypothetical protein